MVPDVKYNESYISFIFTHPEWRRAGIASFMLYHLTQVRCIQTSYTVIRMMTHFGDCASSAAGPRCWNSLLPVICLADLVASFKAQLKTHLFAKACYCRCLQGALVAL